MTSATTLMAAGSALVKRDATLILRRPSRIAGTIITPALLWGFFASGFAGSLADGDRTYTISLAGGSALLIVVFATIFSSLSTIRDRESGFLQVVLVGPTPRWVVVLARVLAGAALAAIQAAPLLVAAAVLGSAASLAGLGEAFLLELMAAVGLAGVCFALAWQFDSIEGFHGVMAGVLMPAWLLSGAILPPQADAGVLSLILAINPLAHAHQAVLSALGVIDDAAIASRVITAGFAVVGVTAAVIAARGDAKR